MENNGSCCGGHHVLKVIVGIIMAIVLVILAVYLVGLTRNSLKSYDYIGKSPDYKNVVTVEGTGKVTAKPDVASVNIGIISEGITVQEVQKQNTDKMNAIISAVKNQFKIEDKDIETNNYTINPKYDWSQKVQRIVGYSINQSINVKIRDFDKVGEILAKASELGANSVNGPQFIIDDSEVYKAQAREKAIAQAKEKAKVLADQVGIDLGRIVSFNEFNPGYPTPMYESAAGFSDQAMLKSSVPSIQAGSDEVIVNVNISYELK